MKKWEYLIVKFYQADHYDVQPDFDGSREGFYESGGSYTRLCEMYNMLGNKGWELVENSKSDVKTFKREK